MWFAWASACLLALSTVPGAVAQSGSAPRSHRGGQGFESPQLHPVFPSQSLDRNEVDQGS